MAFDWELNNAQETDYFIKSGHISNIFSCPIPIIRILVKIKITNDQPI
jgi:hypothetical protein